MGAVHPKSVVSESDSLKRIRLSVLPTRHEDSKGSEIWLLDILDSDMKSLFVEQLELLAPEGWTLKKDKDHPRGIALIAEGENELMLNLPECGVLRFLQHAYSGQARLENPANGKQVMVDLYSAKGNILNFSLATLLSDTE